MTNWKKIGQIVNFKRGYDLPSHMREDGEYPILSSSGITGYHNEFKAEGEGLVTGRYGTLGEMYYINGRYWPHNTALYVTDFKGNHPKYVYYLLKSLTSLSKSDKSTVPGINRNDLHEIEIPYVEREYQVPIASALSALDTKIELNNRINTELEGMAKMLYDYWFVQFDFPNAEGKSYKTSGGKMVWNEELKREIPEVWEVEKLGDYGDFKNGINYDPEIEGDTLAKIINVRNISGSSLSISPYDLDDIYLKGKDVEKYLLTERDILIARSGIPGATRLMLEFDDNTIYCGFIIRFQVQDFQYKNYLFYNLKNLEKSATAKSAGTIMQNINQDTLKNLKFIFPNEEIIVNFNKIIQPIFLKIKDINKENQNLTSLRDWLLPMLMNGQVTVNSVSQPEAKKPAVVQPETLFIANNKRSFAKQVLGGKIVSLFQNDPHFSNIKFQKIQYLAEHVAEVDLNWNYYYQAAGPYDNVYMHSITDKLKTANWFEKRDSKYVPLDKQEHIDRYYQGFFKPVAKQLDQLFSLLANMTDIDAEIIATLYAVWNNRLILSQPVGEELLIDDFYNWSDRKLLYTQEQLQKGLHWMHTNNIVPNGFGKEMKRAKEKVKH